MRPRPLHLNQTASIRAASRQPTCSLTAGTPVADPEQPIEILRTVHSFDPCMACAVHVIDPKGGELSRVKVR